MPLALTNTKSDQRTYNKNNPKRYKALQEGQPRPLTKSYTIPFL